jgi:competence protein ComEC
MNSALKCLVLVLAMGSCLDATAKTLDIYFIDVEGGQSTLVVAPSGQSFLIDTGYAGDGKPQARAGDPKLARDANRILAAAHDARIRQIDYLMITHFHGDHDGGVVELSQLLPIKTFVDHGSVVPEAEQNVPGSLEYFKAYAEVRATGRHLEPNPGERLPLKGVEVTVVSSARATLSRPLGAAGGTNSACGSSGRPAQDPNENPRSTGVLMRFGKFRFLDVGDLSGPPLFALACPTDMIGPVDAYLVAHHGGIDAAEPATFAAFKPRVAVMNNGASKGGALETYTLLHQSADVGDVWQLHRSNAAGGQNFADDHVANLDESTAHWIKLSANEDGSFQVTNGRTGKSKHYPALLHR